VTFQPAGDSRQRSRRSSTSFEAALAQEAAEAPTPRFADQDWAQSPQQAQLPRQAVTAGPLGLGGAPRQQQQLAGAQPAARLALSLKLAPQRSTSLDPDFLTSAERTRFGEAPPSALPDYNTLRRTRSALSDGSPGSGGGSARTGGSGSARDTVGASLGKSLALLRRQGSTQQQQHEQAEMHDALTHAIADGGRGQQHGGAAVPFAAPPPLQQQQPSQRHPPPPAQQQPQAQASSPVSTAGEGDARKMRQQGSFKEQAGEPTSQDGCLFAGL
jgi:hypothetical protein